MHDLVITIVVGVISLILGALATRYYAARRRFSVIIPSMVDLIKISRIARERIRILYKDREVEALWVVRLVLQNRGNLDIDASLVKTSPSIQLAPSLKLMDVEPVHIKDHNSITARLHGEDKVIFDIDYLQRKQQVAFQLLVHTESGKTLRAADIVCDSGTITDTITSFTNLVSNSMPDIFRSIEQFLRLGRKTIIRAYFVLSLGLICAGVLMLLHPWVVQNYGFRLFGTQSPPRVAGIATLIYGMILLFPTMFAFRRLRYLDLFPSQGGTSGHP